jgi:hypothetical protein
MERIKKFEEFLNETIRASEAHRDENAIETVISGKRDVGFITLIGSTLGRDLFWPGVQRGGLKTLRVPSNPYECYIYYRPGAEKDAEELRDIAEKYGGYLAYDATEEDTRRIGELLGYDKGDVEDFITRTKPQ